MSSAKAATTQPSQRPAVLLATGRVLLGLSSLVGLVGAAFFTFVARAGAGAVVTAFDWFVAGWKMIVSLALLAVAVVPRLDRDRRIRLASWLLLADLVFGLVKLIGYHEQASVAFLAVDAVVLALLLAARR